MTRIPHFFLGEKSKPSVLQSSCSSSILSCPEVSEAASSLPAASDPLARRSGERSDDWLEGIEMKREPERVSERTQGLEAEVGVGVGGIEPPREAASARPKAERNETRTKTEGKIDYESRQDLRAEEGARSRRR